MDNDLNKIRYIKQEKIKVLGGDVYHVLKKSQESNFHFGEAYFSFIESNFIKGWKLHKKMNLNLCVPIGIVKFVFVSNDFKNHKTFQLGEENYGRLNVPPNIWYCFKGISDQKSLILNLSSIEHDEKEVNKIQLDKFPLKIKL